MQVSCELEGEPLKKTSLKTTPTASLKSIVVSACEKLKLANPDSFSLKYQRATLDLSLSVRFANLPPGAKLLLVKGRSPAGISDGTERVPEIDIALQIEDLGRMVSKFRVNTSLWDILLFFEQRDSILITRRTGIPENSGQRNLPKALKAIAEGMAKKVDPVYIMPVAVLMNKEYNTISLLKSTTLRDAGLTSGNAVIRILFRFTDLPLDSMLLEIESPGPVVPAADAPESMSQRVKTEESVVKTPPSAPVSRVETNAMDIDGEKLVAAVELGSGGPQERGSVTGGDADVVVSSASAVESTDVSQTRDMRIFRAPPFDANGPQSIELPDSFFELTAAEVKMLLAIQQSKSKALMDAPFMTRAMREEEEEVKRNKYPKTMIRVRFPDRTTLQASFFSREPLSSLYDLLKNSLRSPQRSFSLYVSPPMRTLSDKAANMWTLKLAPASLVYFKWEDNVSDQASPLKDSLLLKIEDLPISPAPVLPVSTDEEGGEAEISVHGVTEDASDLTSVSRSSTSIPSETRDKKFPKWFRKK